MRRSHILLISLVLLFGGSIEAAGAPTKEARTSTPEELEEVLDRIQRECLRAFPPELLEEMTGVQAIPEEVEADPTTHPDFVSEDGELDKGIFYPSLLQELAPGFEAYVEEGSRFLDLGSGDGRVVFLAAYLGAEATGIEYDERLVEVSRRALEALSDIIPADRVRFIRGDFFQHSWSEYDLIFYYDFGSFEPKRLEAKLTQELIPGGHLLVGRGERPYPDFQLVQRFPDLVVYRRAARP
jgi:SAM-dependent methyltransferase